MKVVFIHRDDSIRSLVGGCISPAHELTILSEVNPLTLNDLVRIHPDLIILQWGILWRKTGDFINSLRSAMPEIKIWIMSGNIHPEIQVEILHAGADETFLSVDVLVHLQQAGLTRRH